MRNWQVQPRGGASIVKRANWLRIFKTKGIIRLRNYGIWLSQVFCAIVKNFGKLLLKIIFGSYILPDLLSIKNYPRKIRNLKLGNISFFVVLPDCSMIRLFV